MKMEITFCWTCFHCLNRKLKDKFVNWCSNIQRQFNSHASKNKHNWISWWMCMGKMLWLHRQLVIRKSFWTFERYCFSRIALIKKFTTKNKQKNNLNFVLDSQWTKIDLSNFASCWKLSQHTQKRNMEHNLFQLKRFELLVWLNRVEWKYLWI